MGYTNYWTFEKTISDKETADVKKEIADFVNFAREKGLELVNGLGEPGTLPILDGVISFNGSGEYGHETFYLAEKFTCGQFEFTKTARKPYDSAVVSCLLILKDNLKEYVKISSDGIYLGTDGYIDKEIVYGIRLYVDWKLETGKIDETTDMKEFFFACVNMFADDYQLTDNDISLITEKITEQEVV